MLKLFKKGFYVFLILNALILSSCSSMSEMDCLDTDWETLGYEDGVQGRENTNINSIHPDCTELGLSPHLNAYLAGHEEGLELYCLESNGLFEARNGRSYLGVCPAHLATSFLLGFSNGQQIYLTQTKLNEIIGQIHVSEQELDKMIDTENGAHRLEAAFGALNGSADVYKYVDETKVVLESRILALQQEQEEMEQIINRIESELNVKRAIIQVERVR